MRRLIVLWFALADFAAWCLVAVSIAGLIAYPFIHPVHARMTHAPDEILSVAGVIAVWLPVALGAFAITRRRGLGLILLLVPAAAALFSGQAAFAVGYVLACAIVFAAPFALVVLQARQRVDS